MSCPLNRNRWVGSGYVKDCAPASAAAKEVEAKMLEVLAARNAQDTKYFPSAETELPAYPAQKLINTPVVRK